MTALLLAQMPDLRQMMGKPLPSPELPGGTVSVRVARKLPANAVTDAEVTAIFTKTDGESRKRTAKTGSDGRATFDSIPAGAEFQAEVTVDGEKLQTTRFPMPSQGGVRVMLVAAVEETAPQGKETGPAPTVAGQVAPDDTLPAGTLHVVVHGSDGKPVTGREMQLAEVGRDKGLQVMRATTDTEGRARFEKLATGEQAGYMAMIDHEGLRLATPPFRLPTDRGMRGELRPPVRTTDLSVLRLDQQSRVILLVGEDSLEVMQQLVVKNTSDQTFDPGPGGLVIPLPEGFVGAQELPGGATVEVRAKEGFVTRVGVPPTRTAGLSVELRVRYVLPTGGARRFELNQPMPYGMESPLLLTPASGNLTIEAAGLRPLKDEADKSGNAVKLYEMPPIAPGGKLTLTVTGLPSRPRNGRVVAAVLTVLMMAAAFLFGRRPKVKGTKDGLTADQLVERREKLFAELVEIERSRREATQPEPRLDDRRREIIGKLEGVYRDLARAAEPA